MPVYTETKTYHTKAHMGMIDVTDDFRAAVQNACRKTGMKSGTITGFTTGGVAVAYQGGAAQPVYRYPVREWRDHHRPVAESDPCGVRYPQPRAGYCLSGDGRIIQIENGKWRMENAFRSPFFVQKNKKTPVKAVD